MSDNENEEENGEQQDSEEEYEDGPQEEMPEELLIDILHQKVKKGLKTIGKTVEGQGWAFSQLECEGMNISDLYQVLRGYPHLREINLSRNKIVDYSSMCSTKYLTQLNLKENMVSSFEHFVTPGQLEFLEILDLSDNNLKSLDHFVIKNLKKLILTKNEISSAENFKGHANLQVLQMDQNKMTSLEELKNMPSLLNLSLKDNPVKEFSGLQNTNQIKELNLKNTQIEEFKADVPLPDLPYLNNLILDDCKKFGSMKSIDVLIQYENSLNLIQLNGTLLAEETGDSIKKELLMKLPRLKSVNEEPVEEEEVQAALQEKKEREEEEARKLAEEEEAKRIAEEEEEARKLAEAEEAKNKEGEAEEEEQE